MHLGQDYLQLCATKLGAAAAAAAAAAAGEGEEAQTTGVVEK